MCTCELSNANAAALEALHENLICAASTGMFQSAAGRGKTARGPRSVLEASVFLSWMRVSEGVEALYQGGRVTDRNVHRCLPPWRM
jgi:hypothetical protein